jgi:hypothetical protein
MSPVAHLRDGARYVGLSLRRLPGQMNHPDFLVRGVASATEDCPDASGSDRTVNVPSGW